MAVAVSVVIPTFRRPALLHKCLTAILRQDCPDCPFDVTIVSDGPDPATESLVTEIRNSNPEINFSFFALDQNRGPAAARNFGWRHSSGELIAFTDDDCIPSPDWLAAFWNQYQAEELHSVVFTGKVDVPVPERPTDYQKNVSHLTTAEFITANCACTRIALEEVGGFDETFPTAWREDSDLQFRLLEKRIPILFVEKALVCHPVRDTSWGSSLRDQRKSMFNALLFKKHPELYRQRIASGPVWSYYLIILLSVIAILGFLFQAYWIAFPAVAGWLAAIGIFIFKRLKGTNTSFSHRLEMVVTSFLIPYLSVYWTLRGSLRYRVFFL